MDNREVGPDDVILKKIFQNSLPATIAVIVQDWNKCVLRAEFSDGLDPCVIRLERARHETRMFPQIAALQKVAAIVIPGLVPRTLQLGRATDSRKEEFYFSVVEFVQGSTLEEVWETLSKEEQVSVVEQLGTALEKLHSVRPGDENVQKVIADNECADVESLNLFNQRGVFGGPELGFFQDGPSLLKAIEKNRRRKAPACGMNSSSVRSETTIVSGFEDIGSITISASDMEMWNSEAVLCHNDLTPRNIILRSYTSGTAQSRFELAGIIDWEFAGFFPTSYELGLQDTYFPTANRHVSYYLLLKNRLGQLTQRSPSHSALLGAMDIIYESQQRSLERGHNVPANIRKRFLETLGLVKDQDLYVGWRKSGQEGPLEEYSQEEFTRLENDVIEAMMKKRIESTKPN